MTVITTDIEKKSLEAHVDLCAQRYRYLEEKLENVEGKINKIETMVETISDSVQRMSEKRSDQLLAWGMGIIGSLIATVVWLVTNYVIK